MVNMMNDIDFKNTLIKALELDRSYISDKSEIISILLKSNTYIEYTGLFTRREWNTYCAILHIQVPVEKFELIKNSEKILFDIAEKIFGKQDDYYLTDIEIGIIISSHEIVDFSNIALNDIIKRAIEDAELFMRDGKFDSAFDRIHTAFHGYLRKKLDYLNETYNESDTLSQLFNKLHSHISSQLSSEYSDIVRTTLRSASGIISSINDLRNKFSLVHPNQCIISSREAEFCIKLVKELSDYVEKVV